MELLVNRKSFIVTDHALQRMSERNVSLHEIRPVLEFGTRLKRADGSTRIEMDCEALDRTPEDFLIPYELFGLTIVIKEGNILVTVIRNIESGDIA